MNSLTIPSYAPRQQPADTPTAGAGGDDQRIPPRTLRWYITAVLGLGIPLLALPAVTRLPDGVAILVTTYVLLLGGAVAIARRSGPGGVRELFAGALRWRIGFRNWAFVTLALPATTITIAAITRTLTAPPDGWASIAIGYLVFTFLIGTLALNLWEETAWQGLVQRHLTRRHGRLRGAVLTAIPFALLHVPLSFIGDPTPSEALVSTGVLFVAAPFLRYLLGRTDQTTGGSLLAVGVLHASFNASGSLQALEGGWQHFAAAVVLALFALLIDVRGKPVVADPPGAESGGATASRIVTTIAVFLHLVVLVPFTISSGLMTPLWATMALVLLWIFAAFLLWRAARRRPLATPVVPLLNALLLWAVITAGGGWLGWTA